MTIILGISAFYHDSAAAIVRDGEIIAAAQEERFTRVKHDFSFPRNAVNYCLQESGISVDSLDCVVYYEKPLLKFDRLIETYLDYAPSGFASFFKAMPLWLRSRLHIPREIDRGLGGKYKGPLLFTEHHESHAASAFFPSPFDEAAILTIDGVGEWATTTEAVGRGNNVELLREIRFPHSLGLLYSAFTYYTGFKVNSGEYKVMGLAPYGEPKYVQAIYDNLIDLQDDGSFRLNMDFFNYCQGLTMTNARFDSLFGGPARKPEQRLTQREMDIAASIQVVTEEVMLRLARHTKQQTGMRNLCLAGGCTLNCVANGRILRESIFEDIWIQPASGDAGGALGAALFGWFQYGNNPRIATQGDAQKGSLIGPSFTNEEIAERLSGFGAMLRRGTKDELIHQCVELLASEKIIGWFQGRMEFGPRSLGARSILGDPRSPRMQSQMNLKIKFRESFRPFAPSILRERVSDFFALDCDSPYMLLVAPVKEEHRMPLSQNDSQLWGIDKLNVPRSDIPAVTHVDYSARIQTVDPVRHGRYSDLLSAFEKATGCPVLVNTSFNIRGEPIVCTPEDAYRCFMFTDMDALAIGDFLLLKEDQPPMEGADKYRNSFQLD